MLYIVGLGLGDERGVTVRGLDAVRRCDRVYMEAYTALLTIGPDPPSRFASLEKLYGKEITVADWEVVEEERRDQVLREAAGADVAFLVVGLPFGPEESCSKTTHADLVVRAKQQGIQVKVIDSASLMNAVGACDTDQFYPAIDHNHWLGLHTLCLLDIHAKEPASQTLCRGTKGYEPPRFMTVNTAISQLFELLELRGEPEPAYDTDTLCIGLARLGCDDEKILAGPMGKLIDADFGPPPHCLVIVGETNAVEEEMLEFFMIK